MSLRDGLVFFAPMGASNPPWTQTDYIAGNNLLAPNEAGVVAGQFGRNATHFNLDLIQYLTHDNAPAFEFGDVFSVAIRVKLDELDVNRVPFAAYTILQKGSDAVGPNLHDFNIYIGLAGNIWTFGASVLALVGANTGFLSVNDDTPLAIDTWYLITVEWSNGNLRIRVNGGTVHQSFFSGTKIVKTTPFYVGLNNPDSTAVLNIAGSVMDLGIWGRVLTEQDQLDLAAGATWPFPAAEECAAVECCPDPVTYSSQDSIAGGIGGGVQCGAPTVDIQPPSGSTVSFPTSIILMASDPAALIYYTLDGTAPTIGSLLYAAPFSINDVNTVVSAIAVQGTCAPGPIAVAQYKIHDDIFQFSYSCATTDKAGRWGVFSANTRPDYHWKLQLGLTASTVIKRIELYQTDSTGFWNSGQAWATDEFINPKEGPPGFHVFPLVFFDDGANPNTAYSLANQVNSAYLATFGTFGPTMRFWTMVGQPNYPLSGFFKLLVFLGDGKILESIISTTCGDPPPPCTPLAPPTLIPTCEGIDIVIAATAGTNYEIFRRVGAGQFGLFASGVITTNPQTFHDTTAPEGISCCYKIHLVDAFCDRTSPASCAQKLCLPSVTIAVTPGEISSGEDVTVAFSSTCADRIEVWDCEGLCTTCGEVDDVLSLQPKALYGPQSAGIDTATIGQQIATWADRMGYVDLRFSSADDGIHAPVLQEDGSGRYLEFTQSNLGALTAATAPLASGPTGFSIVTVLKIISAIYIFGNIKRVDGLDGSYWKFELSGTDFVLTVTIDGTPKVVVFSGVAIIAQDFILGLLVDPAWGAILRINGVVYTQRFTTPGSSIQTDVPANFSLCAFPITQTGDSGFNNMSQSSDVNFRDQAIWEDTIVAPHFRLAEELYGAEYGIAITLQSALMLVHRIDDWNPSVPAAGPYGQFNTYIMENISNETLQWQANFENPFLAGPDGQYITMMPPSGILYPGQKVTVEAIVNDKVQTDASPGTIHFINTTNAQGNADAAVSITLT